MIKCKTRYDENKKCHLTSTKRELATRFDFKGLVAEIELNEKAKTVTLSSSSKQKIDTPKIILISKLIKHNILGKEMITHDLKEIESVCTYCGVGCNIVGVVKDNTIEKSMPTKVAI